MSEIKIPPAALEAGARALCNEQRLFWYDLTKDEHDIIRAEARAAFLAMLTAWPGMYIGTDYLTAYTQIKLPLPPQENSDE